jgi:hypothetical protein
MGVWTDATVKAYNIVGRANRYNDEAKAQNALNEVSQQTGLQNVANQTSGLLNTGSYNMSMHEQIMQLIAVSRVLIWVPLPLCITVCKFSEALNQAQIFVFVYKENLMMQTPLPLRLISW